MKHLNILRQQTHLCGLLDRKNGKLYNNNTIELCGEDTCSLMDVSSASISFSSS